MNTNYFVTSSEELSSVYEAVARFSDEVVAPLAVSTDEENTFPHPLWRQMGELGLLGITAPEEYGGSNMGYVAHCVVMEEISRASASIGLSYGAHSNLCINQITLHGSREQKERYLPALISGDKVGALAMSEVGAGSDVVSMRLLAEDKGDHYVLNGHKMWITNAPTADVVVVYAKTDPDAGKRGITAFIVEKGFSGFSCAQKLDKLGMRGSDTGELVFNNCIVPKENVLGEVNRGVGVLMSGLDYERVVLSAGPLGIMRACLDLAVSYARQRQQFGKAIGAFQMIQAKLADMYTHYSASSALVYSTAHACDLNKQDRKAAAACILYSAERATQIALDTIQILGGNGYINEYPSGRLLRDAKLYEIGAGTSEIRRILIGRELFNNE